MWKIAYVKITNPSLPHKAKSIIKFAKCIIAGDVTKEFVKHLNFYLNKKYSDSEKQIRFNIS